jgi:hypothetical protein
MHFQSIQEKGRSTGGKTTMAATTFPSKFIKYSHPPDRLNSGLFTPSSGSSCNASLWWGSLVMTTCRLRRWGETMSLNCGHQRAYCLSPWWCMSMESRCNDTVRGKSENSEKKTCSRLRCYSVHHMEWSGARTQVSAVRGPLLASWAMAQKVYTMEAVCFSETLTHNWSRPTTR